MQKEAKVTSSFGKYEPLLTSDGNINFNLTSFMAPFFQSFPSREQLEDK